MKIHIDDYKGETGIFSLALNESIKEELLSEGVETLFVSDKEIHRFPGNKLITKDEVVIDKLKKCHNFDVFELCDDGNLIQFYDDKSGDTLFFVTEKCNSNCIMCPSPEAARKRGLSVSIDKMIAIASHMPSDTPHVTITGGEPFLAGKDLFRLLYFFRDKFEKTEFLILTNGRIFALREYCDLLFDSIPNHCIIAVPIHGSDDEKHDSITQTPGSFKQTIIGLKRIQKKGIRTEVRIVVNKKNINDIEAIARLIADSLNKVNYVSIMAMEMTGSAFINTKDVWIPYRDTIPSIRKAVRVLMQAGIDVRLYNFPLCVVDNELRTLCYKSISEWKRKYASCCDECTLRDSCGGLFRGSYLLEKDELKTIL